MEVKAQSKGHSGGTEEQMPTVSAGGVPGGDASLGVNIREEPSKPHFWYVAIVKRNSEKVIRDELREKGHTCYVATQTVMRRYAKRRPKAVELVALPAKVFVYLPVLTRRAMNNFLKESPSVFGFMSDCALKGDEKSIGLAAISDWEIQELRRILGNCEDEVTFGELDASFTVGDRVRAVYGPMRGYEGVLAQKNGKSYLVVNMNFLNFARVQISLSDVEPIR